MSGRIPPYAVWLDLETTGSVETKGRIIEIGCLLTHTDPSFREIARFSEVVQDEPVEILRGLMSPEVIAMHEANGLLEELATLGGETGAEVERGVLEWLERHTDGARVALAGSGVAHFDSRWLALHMPTLRARLTYWAFDVGSMRRFGRVAGITLGLPEVKDHRALGDAIVHAEEARAWVEILGRAGRSIEVAS